MIHSVSSDDLTLFSYEILGLVGSTGAAPHDLRAMVRRGRMLDWAGESQYYVEPKRLANLGYLEARKEPGKTRERTIYTLTDKGLQALRDWSSVLLVRFLIFPTSAEQRRYGAFKQDVNLGTYLLYDMINTDSVERLERAMGVPSAGQAEAPDRKSVV